LSAAAVTQRRIGRLGDMSQPAAGERWRRSNAKAIEAHNERVAKKGMFSDRLSALWPARAPPSSARSILFWPAHSRVPA